MQSKSRGTERNDRDNSVLQSVMPYEIVVRALPAREQMRVPSATVF